MSYSVAKNSRKKEVNFDRSSTLTFCFRDSWCEILYFVRGYRVCCVGWQAAYGISSRSLSRAWEQVTDVAVAWMKQFFNHVGDIIMPDGVEINLPSYLNYQLLHG